MFKLLDDSMSSVVHHRHRHHHRRLLRYQQDRNFVFLLSFSCNRNSNTIDSIVGLDRDLKTTTTKRRSGWWWLWAKILDKEHSTVGETVNELTTSLGLRLRKMSNKFDGYYSSDLYPCDWLNHEEMKDVNQNKCIVEYVRVSEFSLAVNWLLMLFS